MIIPVSDLSAYMYCKRKLFLDKVLHIVEVPKDALIKGMLRHDCYDTVNKIEEAIAVSIDHKPTLPELVELYKHHYSTILRKIIIKYKPQLRQINMPLADMFRQTWPVILSESESRAKNIYNFICETNVFGKELWILLTPKIYTEFKIGSPKLGLKGIVDRLEVYTDKYIPFELKTGKMPLHGLWPSHRIQIAAYMLMLEDKFNVDIKSGCIRYIDCNEDRQVIQNPFLREEILSIREEVCSLLSTREIPDFCQSKNKCNSCGIKELCRDGSFINNKLKMLI